MIITRKIGGLALALAAGSLQGQDLAYDGGRGLQALIFQNQIKVEAAVPGTYYGMIGNAWGYGGIQMQGSPSARAGIFSIWDQAEITTEYAYNATLDIQKHGRFGGEGTGAQFLFNHPWRYGATYRCAYRAFVEPDGQHTRFSGFFYDGDLGTWVYAVTYRALTGGLTLETDRFYSFAENYADSWGDRTATFSNAWMYLNGGGWKDLTSGWIFNIPPGDQPQQTDRPDFGQIRTGAEGFRFHSDMDPATKFQAEWAPVAYTATAAESPLVIPYFLGCGSLAAQGNWEPDGYWHDRAGDAGERSNAHAVDLSRVAHPAPAALYQTLRKGRDFQYDLVGFHPGERYLVRLHFVEDTQGAVGARRQNVQVNGVTALENFDILRQAGSRNTAVVKELEATADASGQIRIRFTAAPGSPVQEAVVCALAVTSGRPAFKVVTAPEPLTVMRGYGAQTRVNVVGLNGFNEPVALGLHGLPFGVTSKLTPEPVRFDSGAATVATTLTVSTLHASSHGWCGGDGEAEAMLMARSGHQVEHRPFRVQFIAPVPAFVQATGSVYVEQADAVTATVPGTQVAGDLNVVVVQWQDADASVTGVTDTAGNPYTLAVGPTRNPDQPGSQAIYIAPRIQDAGPGANTVTVTFDRPAAYPDILVADYVGVRTLVGAVANTGDTEGLDSGPLATTAPNTLVVSATCVPWWTDAPGEGFTSRIQSDWGNLLQDLLAGKPGIYRATATQNGGAPWIIQAIALK